MMTGFFRNLPLPLKLILIGIVPLAFVIYLSFQVYNEKKNNVENIVGYVDRINVIGKISELIDELQTEQKLSFDYIIRKDSSGEMLRQRSRTDSALKEVRRSNDETLKGFENYTSLYLLNGLRSKIDSGKAAAGEVTHLFSNTMFRLNTLTDVTFGDKELLQTYHRDIQSQKILTEMLTYLGIIRSNIYNVLITRSYMIETLIGTQGAYDVYKSYEKELLIKAEPATAGLYTQVKQQTAFNPTIKYIDARFATFKFDSSYTADQWWDISDKGFNELSILQKQIWRRVNTQIEAAYNDEVQKKNITLILLIIAIVAVGAIISYTINILTKIFLELKVGAEKIAAGHAVEPFNLNSNDAIGSLADSISRINQNNIELMHAADAIGKGDFSTPLQPRSEGDVLTNAIIRMKENLQYFIKEIEEREFRFRQMADLIPQIVWTTDANGKTDYLNKKWYEYAGDNEMPEVVHPEDREPSNVLWAIASEKKSDYNFELRLRNFATKEYRWFLVRAIPILDANGEIIKWFGTSTDIHEKKAVQEELQDLVKERTEELKRSNDDLQGFAHVASHDLKEPLRKIQVFSNMLIDDENNTITERSRGYLSKIQDAAKRLMSMIEGILNYSTINASAEPLETIDLNKIIDEIKGDLELVIEKKNAHIHHNYLPVIKGVPMLIHQLFYNLISNSLKFTNEDVQPVITITASEAGTSPGKSKLYLEIKVEDNGIGFSKSEADKIFDVFSRLNPRHKFEGTGLGLALCKKIMTRHQGLIYATSEDKKGSIFYLLFPLHLVVRPDVKESSVINI